MATTADPSVRMVGCHANTVQATIILRRVNSANEIYVCVCVCVCVIIILAVVSIDSMILELKLYTFIVSVLLILASGGTRGRLKSHCCSSEQ